MNTYNIFSQRGLGVSLSLYIDMKDDWVDNPSYYINEEEGSWLSNIAIVKIRAKR